MALQGVCPRPGYINVSMSSVHSHGITTPNSGATYAQITMPASSLAEDGTYLSLTWISMKVFLVATCILLPCAFFLLWRRRSRSREGQRGIEIEREKLDQIVGQTEGFSEGKRDVPEEPGYNDRNSGLGNEYQVPSEQTEETAVLCPLKDAYREMGRKEILPLTQNNQEPSAPEGELALLQENINNFGRQHARDDNLSCENILSEVSERQLIYEANGCNPKDRQNGLTETVKNPFTDNDHSGRDVNSTAACVTSLLPNFVLGDEDKFPASSKLHIAGNLGGDWKKYHVPQGYQQPCTQRVPGIDQQKPDNFFGRMDHTNPVATKESRCIDTSKMVQVGSRETAFDANLIHTAEESSIMMETCGRSPTSNLLEVSKTNEKVSINEFPFQSLNDNPKEESSSTCAGISNIPSVIQALDVSLVIGDNTSNCVDYLGMTSESDDFLRTQCLSSPQTNEKQENNHPGFLNGKSKDVAITPVASIQPTSENKNVNSNSDDGWFDSTNYQNTTEHLPCHKDTAETSIPNTPFLPRSDSYRLTSLNHPAAEPNNRDENPSKYVLQDISGTFLQNGQRDTGEVLDESTMDLSSDSCLDKAVVALFDERSDVTNALEIGQEMAYSVTNKMITAKCELIKQEKTADIDSIHLNRDQTFMYQGTSDDRHLLGSYNEGRYSATVDIIHDTNTESPPDTVGSATRSTSQTVSKTSLSEIHPCNTDNAVHTNCGFHALDLGLREVAIMKQSVDKNDRHKNKTSNEKSGVDSSCNVDVEKLNLEVSGNDLDVNEPDDSSDNVKSYNIPLDPVVIIVNKPTDTRTIRDNENDGVSSGLIQWPHVATLEDEVVSSLLEANRQRTASESEHENPSWNWVTMSGTHLRPRRRKERSLFASRFKSFEKEVKEEPKTLADFIPGAPFLTGDQL